jgi:6-phospho-beta-glucosidase
MLLKNKYKNLPIVIMENGIGMKESLDKNGEINDDGRIDYIKEHLLKINEAIKDGSNVFGYCN